MKLPAIVLAAGASRRLGRPKQLVAVGGETLLARAIRVAGEAGADPVLVVLGANAEAVAQAVRGAEVVVNPEWEQGIATSIRAGIEAVQRMEAAAAMILVCDQPRLTAAHLGALRAAFQESNSAAIVASRYGGIDGIPAIFPASQFPKLLALKGDAGARYLLRNPDCALVTVDFAGGDVDIDTPEDLARVVPTEL